MAPTPWMTSSVESSRGHESLVQVSWRFSRITRALCSTSFKNVPHPLKNAPTAPFAIRSRPLPSRHREVRMSRGMGGRPPPRRLSTMNTHTDVRPVVGKGYPFMLTVALPR